MSQKSGCNWLSIAVGNIHGAMTGSTQFKEKETSHLDLELIKTLNKTSNIPLVLHGGSAIQINELCSAFKMGISKINVAKDIRLLYHNALKTKESVLKAKQAVYDRITWLIKDQYEISNSSNTIIS